MASGTLLAGPFAGEFGWELLSWQAYVRKQSRGFATTIVSCPPGHQALYQDFTPLILTHAIQGVKDCWRTSPDQAPQLRQAYNLLVPQHSGTLLACRRRYELAEQEFIRFGTLQRVTESERCDVLLHVREAFGKHPEHSWAPLHAELVTDVLRKQGFSVGAIGTQAYCPQNAKDLRRIDLSRLMDLMAAAKLVAGPSSGPLHLASLCGTPQVVWTDKQVYSALGGTNRQRYEMLWNPLQTPVTVIDEFGWQPPVGAIVKAVRESCACLKSSPKS